MAFSIYPSVTVYSYFSTDLEEFVITTDQPYCDLLILDSDTGATVFNSRFYTCDGKITVHGVRELLESTMLSKGVTINQFSFEFDDDDDFRVFDPLVFYTTHILEPTTEPKVFAASNCMTGFPTQLVSRTGVAYFYFYTDLYQININSTYAYRDSQGNIQTYNVANTIRRGTTTYGLKTMMVRYSDLLSYLQDADLDATEVLAYSFSDGAHYAAVYFTGIHTLDFLYKNRFGLWETVCIPCSQTSKTETDFATAICNELIMQYDVQHKQTIEVQTPVLSRNLARQITEMLTSNEVRLCDRTAISEMPTIIINEYTSELANSPNSANSIKFTWQYQDRRLRQTIPADVPQIFTTEFDYPFS